MQNIKMIVTDLDRTLLGANDKIISEYSANVFKKCIAKGIKVVFATARPKRVTTQFLEYIPADAIILHNGALIYTGGEQIFHCGIPSDITKNILREISRDFPEATLSVEIADVLYTNFEAKFDPSTANWDYTILNKLSECVPDNPAEKIIVGLRSVNMMTETPEDVIKCFGKYVNDDLYVEINTERFLFIMNRKAKKSSAVKFLAEHYGYKMNEVVAFGDDYNDVEMLKECGIGVAVSNAIDEAKAAADYVCGSNDNDGVAKWIEENILHQPQNLIKRV